jgi:hypothetical protein
MQSQSAFSNCGIGERYCVQKCQTIPGSRAVGAGKMGAWDGLKLANGA